MKLSILKSAISLFAAVLTVASSQASFAQSSNTVAKVNIPFGFEYGSQYLPAGRYEIALNSNHIMWIGSSAKSGFTMTQSQVNFRPAADGKVVFRKYGDRYFLKELWFKGETSHISTIKVKAEEQAIEMERAANNNSSAAGVEIALAEIPR